MANPWFRMYSEFSHDPKVQMMSEVMQRRYIMIMCLRCSDPERFISDEEVAFRLRISMDEVVVTKRALIEIKLIDNKWLLVKKLETNAERPPAHIWRDIRNRIFKRDDYTCKYCGERGKKLECDHVVPVARGGSHDDDNLVTSCFKCNRSKRDKLVSEWRAA